MWRIWGEGEGRSVEEVDGLGVEKERGVDVEKGYGDKNVGVGVGWGEEE